MCKLVCVQLHTAECHLESQGEVIKYWAWNNKDVIVMHFYIYKLNIHIKPLASETSEFYFALFCAVCATHKHAERHLIKAIRATT